MRQLLVMTVHFFEPVIEIPKVREWLLFVDDNLMVLGSLAALFISLVLWANI
jgi:hypothetical protein